MTVYELIQHLKEEDPYAEVGFGRAYDEKQDPVRRYISTFRSGKYRRIYIDPKPREDETE